MERRGHPLDKQDFHSLRWLRYAYLQLGRIEKAQATLETALAAAQASGDRYQRGTSPSSMAARQAVETGSGLARNVRVETAVETSAVTAEPFPKSCDAHASHSYGAGEATKQLFAAGFAAARQGDAAAARNLAERLAKLAGTGDSVEDQELRIMAREPRGSPISGTGTSTRLRGPRRGGADRGRAGLPLGPPSPIKPAHESTARSCWRAAASRRPAPSWPRP